MRFDYEFKHGDGGNSSVPELYYTFFRRRESHKKIG